MGAGDDQINSSAFPSSVTKAFTVDGHLYATPANLATVALYSFESKDYPNGYLRQSNGAVYQQQNDNSAQFASDATFCPTRGNNGQGVSLSSAADSAFFLRHYNGQVYIASNGGPASWDASASWTDDASFIPTPAWAP